MNKKPIVILVDDSAAIRSFFKSALSELNFEVYAEEDPHAALFLMKSIEPDCILSDFEMPNMTGIEFCREVKKIEKFKNTPFVILSMHDNDQYILESLKAGADDYLPKRTNPEVIVAKVKIMIELSLYRQSEAQKNKLKTYKATVVTLQHEWTNLATIVFSFLKKFDHSEFAESSQNLRKNLERILKLINQLQGLNEIELEHYSTADNPSEIIRLDKKIG